MDGLAVRDEAQASTCEHGLGRVLVIGRARRGVSFSDDLDEVDCELTQVVSVPAALNAVRYESFDLVLFCHEAVPDEGLELVSRLLTEQPGLDIVIIAAAATLDGVLAAMRVGASDYLPAPVSSMRIRQVLEEKRRSRRLRVTTASRPRRPRLPLDTASPRMRAVLRQVERAAASDLPVLLHGERGTGKGVLARSLHAYGPRRDRPFVIVRCDHRSEEHLLREVFGSAQGGFAGATRDDQGAVQSARGGTLFLDGLSEPSPTLAERLGRLVRYGNVDPVGDQPIRGPDVRLVASVSDGGEHRWFGDATQGTEGMEIAVPPLRERVQDILRLAWTFAAAAARRAREAVPSFSPAMEERLLTSRWPGNVSELRSVVERAVLDTRGDMTLPDGFRDLTPVHIQPPLLGGNFSVEEVEREHIRRVIERAPTLREAARILRVNPSSLYRWRKKWVAEASARPLLPLSPERGHRDAENA